MITKENLKEFFRPTKLNITITIIFIIGLVFLSNIMPSFLNISFLFPSFDLFCSPIQNYLDQSYLNSISREAQNSVPVKELLNINDSWIPVLFFCILPIRIIYYYLIICLILFMIKKIRKKK